MSYSSIPVEAEIELLIQQPCLGIQYLCKNPAVIDAILAVYRPLDACYTLQKQLLYVAREIVPHDLCWAVHLLETEDELSQKRYNKHLYSKELQVAHNAEYFAWRNRGLTGAIAYAFEGKQLSEFDEEIYEKYYTLSTEIKKRFLSKLLSDFRLTFQKV